eukprot:TRINITY_DN12945_c0_g1_i1.p1 TRINITY_DN12945_c0_g1~~TRINITY_DN12945_c0_g1_i1.p1  ORF type:complete len:1057 (+),score=323.12 TRINITY_DN12945_c0_g1_i1:104-3274(+)
MDRQFAEIIQQNLSFEAYERHFQQSLLELDGDELLSPLKADLSDLHATFLRFHDQEKRLIRKCQELQAEIVSYQNKIRVAQDLSHGDTQTLESLRREISKTRAQLQASQEKDGVLRERIRALKQEVWELEIRVRKGVVGTVRQDELRDLQRLRDSLVSDRDSRASRLTAARADIDSLLASNADLQQRRDAAAAELARLAAEEERVQAVVDEQQQRHKRWDEELLERKAALVQKTADLTQKQAEVKAVDDSVSRTQRYIHEQQEVAAATIAEFEQLTQRMAQLQAETDEEMARNTGLLRANHALEQQTHVSQQDVQGIEERIAKQTRLRDAAQGRLDAMRLKLADERSEAQARHAEAEALELEVDALRQRVEAGRRAVEALRREGDVLSKTRRKAVDVTSRHRQLVSVRSSQLQNVKAEVIGVDQQCSRLRAEVFALKDSAAAYQAKATEATMRYKKGAEDAKRQEEAIAASQQQLKEVETKVTQQQLLHTEMVDERNVISKNLLALHAEINALRRTFRGLLHEIGLRRGDVAAKDRQILVDHVRCHALSREHARHAAERQRYERLVTLATDRIALLQKDAASLSEVVESADVEARQQQREYDALMAERDVLGLQLVRRNDALAQLYERIRVQEADIQRGSARHRHRMRATQTKEERLRQTRTDLSSLLQFTARREELKRELVRAQGARDDLLVKQRALDDAVVQRMNIHRWSLAGGSATAPQRVQRVQALQQRLVRKASELEERGKLVREMEKKYSKLQALHARQPGAAAAEQLEKFEQDLRVKMGQLRSLKNTLGHYRGRVAEDTARMERMDAQLGDVRKAYFERLRQQRRQLRLTASDAHGAGGGDIPTIEELHEEREGLEEALADAQAERLQIEAARAQRAAQRAAMMDDASENARGAVDDTGLAEGGGAPDPGLDLDESDRGEGGDPRSGADHDDDDDAEMGDPEDEAAAIAEATEALREAEREVAEKFAEDVAAGAVEHDFSGDRDESAGNATEAPAEADPGDDVRAAGGHADPAPPGAGDNESGPAAADRPGGRGLRLLPGEESDDDEAG